MVVYIVKVFAYSKCIHRFEFLEFDKADKCAKQYEKKKYHVVISQYFR